MLERPAQAVVRPRRNDVEVLQGDALEESVKCRPLFWPVLATDALILEHLDDLPFVSLHGSF